MSVPLLAHPDRPSRSRLTARLYHCSPRIARRDWAGAWFQPGEHSGNREQGFTSNVIDGIMLEGFAKS
jgi:hypothetical protein